MIRWLTKLYDRRRRALDIAILWPICKERTVDLDQAKSVFAFHAFRDNAWASLGHDDIVAIIDRLT